MYSVINILLQIYEQVFWKVRFFWNHDKLVPINIQTLQLSEKSTIHTKGNTRLANIGFIAWNETKRIRNQLGRTLTVS